jgi:uroporphyrinogen-III decarboxylase
LQPCDACCGYEQAAIDAYLAEVPLPEGWTEERNSEGYRYYATDVPDAPIERVAAFVSSVKVWPSPAHWPAIPLPVLIRAAVQCHRLREGQ